MNTWPDAGDKAWKDVNVIAERAENQPPAFGDSEAYLKLFREVLDTVARRFYPDSDEPALEITVPQALEITERVARDFRTVLDEQVPLSDKLTVRNIRSIQRLSEWIPIAEQVYSAADALYRLGRFVLNPTSAVISEAQAVMLGTNSSIFSPMYRVWQRGIAYGGLDTTRFNCIAAKAHLICRSSPTSVPTSHCASCCSAKPKLANRASSMGAVWADPGEDRCAALYRDHC